jgi:dynein heavy chain, axonemal
MNVALHLAGEQYTSVTTPCCCAGEGERVSLGKNLKARGNVEKWLSDVEAGMIQSLRSVRC